MSKTNWDMAHNFFYNEACEDDYPRYKSCGYRGNRFFSYATVIAMIVENKEGHKVTLVSDNNMSNTTAKHLSNVRSASPYKNYWVPFSYGERPENLEDVASLFQQALGSRSKLNFCLQNNRFAFCDTFVEATKFSEDIFELDFLDNYKGLYSQLNDPEAVKKLKAEARKANQEKVKALREELKKIIETNSYLDLIKIAFSNYYYIAYNNAIRGKLAKVLNPKGELSFVWRDSNGLYKTSKHVTMPKAEGDIALRLWAKGQLKHGQKVGMYTVLAVTKDFVKVGCHTIPTKNLEELYKTL